MERIEGFQPKNNDEVREKELFLSVPHAIILCGGQGTRLGLTDRPKPMADVNGRTIFEYQIDAIQRYGGVNNIVFAAGHLANVLADHVGNGSRYDVTATVSIEDTPLGRGGAIKKALRELPSGWREAIVTNGDNLWNLDIQEMISQHRKAQATATIAVVQPMDQFGRVEFTEDGTVTKFGEKEKRPDWINAGIYIFSRNILDQLPDIGDHETTTFQNLVVEGTLQVFKSEGFWKNIDTLKDLEEARKEAPKHFL